MAGLDALLEEQGCRALVVLSRSVGDPYMAPFLGGGRLGYALLVAARGRRPRLGYLSPMERDEAAFSTLPLLTPQALDIQRFARDGAKPHELWSGVLERALQLCEVSPGRVALAGTMPAGYVREMCRPLEEAGWSFEPGEEITSLLRKTKGRLEVAEIRRAADGAADAFRHAAGLLAAADIADGGELRLGGEPLRVGRLRRDIARVLVDHGLEQPEGNIVAPAEEGAVPHTTGTDDRVLCAGESLVVDLFPRGRMYADCTRTFCVGPPPEGLARGHALVRQALETAESMARAGTGTWPLQEAVCELFEDAGFPTPISHHGTQRGYVHGLGHGVGYELHELPSFREHVPSRESTLEIGDVLTLEPGLYEPEDGWAVRLEDLYLLGTDGAVSLTPLPRELDPRAW